MSDFKIASRCECQATLSATLDDQRQVLTGRAARGTASELAPAHTIGALQDRFDVGWACPFCGRNTIRSFQASALARGAEPPAS